MPKVSDAYRQARRDEIVGATLRALSRRGLSTLTMADVIEESGLSAGSVYTHFTSKHELIAVAATHVIGERAERLSSEFESQPRSPLEVVRWWLSGLESEGVPFGAALQLWGEAATDPSIRPIVESRMSATEDAFTKAVERWLVETDGEPATARSTARAMLTFCQGYIVRTALLGPQDLESALSAANLLR